eukprot:NODE_98_length_21025_cov_0.475055.p16 type:complete len:104 gc:universal NODE_98_length_21025_cov_0.475055:15083-15394(+)
MLCLDNKLLFGSGPCNKAGLYSDEGHYINDPQKIQIYTLDDKLMYVDTIKIKGAMDKIEPLLAPLPRLHNPQPTQAQSGIKWYWYLLGGWFILNIIGGVGASK